MSSFLEDRFGNEENTFRSLSHALNPIWSFVYDAVKRLTGETWLNGSSTRCRPPEMIAAPVALGPGEFWLPGRTRTALPAFFSRIALVSAGATVILGQVIFHAS